MEAIQGTADGVLLRLHVQPRASTERCEGIHGDQVRLRLTAPPVDGAANAACIAFVAKCLGIKRSAITLQAGARSRDKLLSIRGMTPAQVAAALGVAFTES